MRTNQKRKLQALRAARAFLARTALDVPMLTLDAHIGALDEVIARLTHHQVEQDRLARLSLAATASVKSGVRNLREAFLKPVLAVARAPLAGGGGLERAVSLPRGRNPQVMITAVLAIADVVESSIATYMKMGFEADVAGQLRNAARQLTQRIDERAAVAAGRQAATAGLAEEVRRGAVFIAFVGSAVDSAVQEHPSLRAEWRAIRRIARRSAVLTRNVGGGARSANQHHATTPADRRNRSIETHRDSTDVTETLETVHQSAGCSVEGQYRPLVRTGDAQEAVVTGDVESPTVSVDENVVPGIAHQVEAPQDPVLRDGEEIAPLLVIAVACQYPPALFIARR